MKISVCVIGLNEEQNLADCLASVKTVADEIIFVDSFSQDATVKIARRFTKKIFTRKFDNYVAQKNFAASKAKFDWILNLDCDERLSPELAAAILALKKNPPADLIAYRFNRLTWYLYRFIRHSGWYPDYQMRLYRKAASYWDGVAPHEVAHVRGRVEVLPGELLHYTKRDLSEHHRVLDTYTTLAAEHLFNNGKRTRALDLFVLPIAAFIRTYIMKQGFRDGVQGLIIAMFTAYSVFLKYAKIWEQAQLESKESK